MLEKQNPAAGRTAGHYQKKNLSHQQRFCFLYMIGLLGTLYIECQFGML